MASRISQVWEAVSQGPNEVTERHAVPGGWIYRTALRSGKVSRDESLTGALAGTEPQAPFTAVALCFVPDKMSRVRAARAARNR